MWKALVLSVAGLLILQSKAQAWPNKNEAEELFRRMEAKLTKAKTVEFQFESTLQACPGGIVNGSVILAEGNKRRIETEDRHPGSKSVTVIAGNQYVSPIWKRAVPNWYTEALRVGYIRSSVMLTPLIPLADEGKEFNADDAFTLTDFKFAGNEIPGPRDARVIQYILTTRGLEVRRKKTSLMVRVWIDPKTDLPVQRVVIPMESDLGFMETETYRGFTLDGKIDPKLFEVPKK